MTPVAHPRLPVPGRLWGASRPGYPDARATPQQVEAGVREWVGKGVDAVLTLMEDEEIQRICPGFLEALARHDLESLRFPIRDFGAPEPHETEAFCALVVDVRVRLTRGQSIVVHCNAGQGRTAVFLATLLRHCGLPGDPVEEIRRIYYRDAMRSAPQEEFVRALALGVDGNGR
jgi:protein-tyrosine phosphatase